MLKHSVATAGESIHVAVGGEASWIPSARRILNAQLAVQSVRAWCPGRTPGQRRKQGCNALLTTAIVCDDALGQQLIAQPLKAGGHGCSRLRRRPAGVATPAAAYGTCEAPGGPMPWWQHGVTGRDRDVSKGE